MYHTTWLMENRCKSIDATSTLSVSTYFRSQWCLFAELYICHKHVLVLILQSRFPFAPKEVRDLRARSVLIFSQRVTVIQSMHICAVLSIGFLAKRRLSPFLHSSLRGTRGELNCGANFYPKNVNFVDSSKLLRGWWGLPTERFALGEGQVLPPLPPRRPFQFITPSFKTQGGGRSRILRLSVHNDACANCISNNFAVHVCRIKDYPWQDDLKLQICFEHTYNFRVCKSFCVVFRLRWCYVITHPYGHASCLICLTSACRSSHAHLSKSRICSAVAQPNPFNLYCSLLRVAVQLVPHDICRRKPNVDFQVSPQNMTSFSRCVRIAFLVYSVVFFRLSLFAFAFRKLLLSYRSWLAEKRISCLLSYKLSVTFLSARYTHRNQALFGAGPMVQSSTSTDENPRMYNTRVPAGRQMEHIII